MHVLPASCFSVWSLIWQHATLPPAELSTHTRAQTHFLPFITTHADAFFPCCQTGIIHCVCVQNIWCIVALILLFKNQIFSALIVCNCDLNLKCFCYRRDNIFISYMQNYHRFMKVWSHIKAEDYESIYILGKCIRTLRLLNRNNTLC